MTSILHLFLEVVEGSGVIGRSFWLEAGDICRIGSDPKCEFAFSASAVAPTTATLLFDGKKTTLYAGPEVSIGGRKPEPVEELGCGDSFRIGEFRIQLRLYPFSLKDCTGSPLRELIRWMTPSTGNFYAIYDAARDARVLELLRVGSLKNLSLFDGELRKRMADAAPYLVEIPRDGPALELLIRASWGKGWASFLCTEMSFDAVRSQLRRLLMVRLPNNTLAYFRYFDPAVLQSLLQGSSLKEWREFYGEIRAFIVETNSESKSAIRFSLSAEGTRIETHELQQINLLGESNPARCGDR
jgi:hypothetical protein